jgi:hypothetical protein
MFVREICVLSDGPPANTMFPVSCFDMKLKYERFALPVISLERAFVRGGKTEGDLQKV